MSTVVMDKPCKHDALSLLFWGTESLFSQQLLTRLATAFAIQAVFLPARPGQLAMAEDGPVQQVRPAVAPPSSGELAILTQFVTTTTLHTAWQHNLTVYTLRTIHHAALVQLLQTLAPDLVCVACFPWRIPAKLLAIPTYGFVNLHPSLLPAYRGPAPLFWQLRDGLQHSGITLHRMDQRFDTGEIIAQQSLSLPEGASAATIDNAYAQAAAPLLTSFLAALTRHGASAIQGQPQVGRASKQSWPEAVDFVLDLTWSARRAFNFMRGTAEWDHPYQVALARQTYLLHSALRYSATERLAEPVTKQAGELAIQFNPGVLYARGIQC